MTLEEAIKILNDMLQACTNLQYTDHPKALKLGIEALKRIKEQRGYAQNFNYLPLPGETEE